MTIFYTWDDIWQLAEGRPCGHPDLNRYDVARGTMRDCILASDGIDIEDRKKVECAEDYIEDFISRRGLNTVYFDDYGHLYLMYLGGKA